MNNNSLVVKKGVKQKAKDKNLSNVFKLILENKGITRVEIAKKLGIATSTVSLLTEELISKRLIVTQGLADAEQVGRKAICLQINPLGGFCCCVHLKKGVLDVVIFDLDLNVDYNFSVNVRGCIDSSNIVKFLEENIQENYKYGKFLGIVFIFPTWIKKLSSWDDFYSEYGYKFSDDYLIKLKRYYSEVFVCQENAMILNSFSIVLDSKQTSFYINCGEELLSCIVTPDIVNVANIIINDFGDIGVNITEYDCETGKYGRIKEYLSTNSIIDEVNKTIGANYNFNQIVAGYNEEETRIVRIIDEKAKYFAYALSSSIVIANIKNIVIGGQLVSLGEKFKEKIKFYLSKINADSKYVLNFYDDEKCVARNGARFVFDAVFDEGNIDYYTNI